MHSPYSKKSLSKKTVSQIIQGRRRTLHTAPITTVGVLMATVTLISITTILIIFTLMNTNKDQDPPQLGHLRMEVAARLGTSVSM